MLKIIMPRSTAALFALLALFPSHALPASNPDSSAPAESYPPAELRADFDELRATLYQSHIDAFAGRSRAELDAAFERMAERLDRPMSRAEAALVFQRWVALGDIAHARVEDAGLAFAAYVGSDEPIVPFDLRVVDGRLYVADVFPGGEALRPGDRLIALAGRDGAALRRAMHEELSADNDYLADTLLEFEFPRVLWQRIGAPETYTVRVERGGRTLEFELSGNRPSERRSALKGGYLSLSWSEREAEMLDCATAYLRPGPFYNPDGEMWDTTAFEAFIDDAFERFRAAGAERLLVDLRNNAGGDASFSDYLLAWFADAPFRFNSRFEVRNSRAAREANAQRLEAGSSSRISRAYAAAYAEHADGSVFEFETPVSEPRDEPRFDGEVYLLVNRHSYSNAVTLSAMVQDYDFGTVLGEPTADLATTLGAMEQFTLTRTGLRIGFPKARIVRPSGDERRVGVRPDVVIETPRIESADDPVRTRALQRVCPADFSTR